MSLIEGPWLFVINPYSGNGIAGKMERDIRDWSDTFEKKSEVIKTRAIGHASQVVSDKANEFSVVVAVGGDGTVNEVGGALLNARAAMGIIPCGSGNGLARHLKYPTDPRIALKQLNHATPTEIDTLQVNGRTCLNVAGIGFDGYIASEFGQGGRRGLYGYIRTTLGAVTRLKEFHIEYDGYVNQKSSSATMLVITNGSQYGNNAYLNPMADVSDGKFEIIEILCRGPFDAIGLVLRSFNKKLLGSPLVNFHQHVGELNLTLSDFQPYHIDGEPMEQEKKFCLRINPQSLRVLHFPNHSLRL